MPTYTAPSIPRPTHATPDHHEMVRRLGHKGTVAIMKDSRLTPAFSVMSVVIALIAAAFAVATTFPVTTVFP